jgi:signal transduction histidine kinase
MHFRNLLSDARTRVSPLLVVSLLVSCLTAAVAIYAWSSLVRSQHTHLRAGIHGLAREVADALERRSWSQSVALRDLAYGWGRFEPKDEVEWRHDASALMSQFPCIRSVTWGSGEDTRELRADMVAIRPGYEAELAAAQERVATGSVPNALVSPVQFANDRYGFVVFLGAPAPADVARRPVLRAVFDFESFTVNAFDDRADGYAFTLWSGDLEVAKGAETPADGVAWWTASQAATHPLGASWRIELRPGPAVARRELSILPHVLLATGLLAAGMIGALVWTARVAARRARALEATNAALAEIAEHARPDARRRDPSAGADVEHTAPERAEELREAVLDLEAFNVSVSHDLRSPIGAIVNLTTVLRETQRDSLPPAAVDLVRRIESSALRALARMDGLLDFSRLGRKPLRRERVDLHRLAWRIAQEIRQTEAGSRVEFVLHPLPPAEGDSGMIEALLRNLLSNGAKFARGQEKPRVELGALSDDSKTPGECVYFVRDNGVGFDPRFADKVFGLFERQHHTSEFEGTGVGLAIVSRIARRHGGRVWAESELGGGATFYFTLGPDHA